MQPKFTRKVGLLFVIIQRSGALKHTDKLLLSPLLKRYVRKVCVTKRSSGSSVRYKINDIIVSARMRPDTSWYVIKCLVWEFLFFFSDYLGQKSSRCAPVLPYAVSCEVYGKRVPLTNTLIFSWVVLCQFGPFHKSGLLSLAKIYKWGNFCNIPRPNNVANLWWRAGGSLVNFRTTNSNEKQITLLLGTY